MLAWPAPTSPATGAACTEAPHTKAKAKGSCCNTKLNQWPRAVAVLLDWALPRTCSDVATQVPKRGLQTER
jgi:hypothetical protein